jgi:thymidine phosphorylase
MTRPSSAATSWACRKTRLQQLGVQDGHTASISQAEPPASMAMLFRKIGGERLGREDFRAIVQDIASHHYSKIELTAFVVACNRAELDREEVYFLTEAMVASGRTLDWREPLVVDKHCIGGIPGNRTSMLVVPIVAAHGLLCPKTSSRAITSPAGTADTMAVLANVELPFASLEQIVRTHRGCLAWGGTADLSPADDVLISVERPLSIDSPGQMVASILSKKIAAGSTHLVLDIPIGPTAKVRSMPEAQRLRRLFEYVAGRMHLALDVVITDGRQPIGNGIGPVLEARDVMQVLQNDPRCADRPAPEGAAPGRAPDRMRPRCARRRRLCHCARHPRLRTGAEPHECHHRGAGQPVLRPERARLGALTFEVRADARRVWWPASTTCRSRASRAWPEHPRCQAPGVDLLRKLGHAVAAGDLLYRVHADFPADLEFARQACERASGFTIGGADAQPHVLWSSDASATHPAVFRRRTGRRPAPGQAAGLVPAPVQRHRHLSPTARSGCACLTPCPNAWCCCARSTIRTRSWWTCCWPPAPRGCWARGT